MIWFLDKPQGFSFFRYTLSPSLTFVFFFQIPEEITLSAAGLSDIQQQDVRREERKEQTVFGGGGESLGRAPPLLAKPLPLEEVQ